MRIPGAAQRAAARVRENATPLYDYIMKNLGGVPTPGLGSGPGALTSAIAKAVQKPGFRGFLDLILFEKPRGTARKNKFTTQGALPFTGIYPRELCNAKGLEVFYDEDVKKK